MFSRSGFTLIEILVVIGLMLMLIGVSTPMFRLARIDDRLATTKQQLLADLYLVQAKAKAGVGGNLHGILLKPGIPLSTQYQLYEENYIGDNLYAARELPEGISVSISGQQLFGRVAFTPYDGLPTVTGTIFIEAINEDKEETIVINELGLMY